MQPSLTYGQLYAPGTVLASGYDLNVMRLMFKQDWQIEAVSGIPLAVLGDAPALCHADAMTDAALAFFQRAGVKTTTLLRPYRSEAEAFDIIRELRKVESRFVYLFPLAETIRQSCTLLVDPRVYNWINNKANLAQLCDPRWLLPRRIYPMSQIAALRARPPNRPVYVKGAINAPHGAGVDVRYCPGAEAWSSVLDWVESMADWFTACIIEDAARFSRLWCLNYALMGRDIRYIGAAEQLFSAPGMQSGSLMDDTCPPPDKAVEIGYQISLQAERRGYRGFAGYDMGVAEDGRIYFFDLNFRLNSSTPALLFHHGTERGSDPRVSVVCNQLTTLPLEEALSKLEDLVVDGAFVPTRLYDGSKHSGCAPSVITGILTAPSRHAVADLQAELSRRFADVAWAGGLWATNRDPG
jgi:hypothetical protein